VRRRRCSAGTQPRLKLTAATAPAVSGIRGDLDGDLILLEQVDQSKHWVAALLGFDHSRQFSGRKYPCGAPKRLPSHFPALGTHSKLDAGIIGDSLDLPRLGLSGDNNLLTDDIEPDRG